MSNHHRIAASALIILLISMTALFYQAAAQSTGVAAGTSGSGAATASITVVKKANPEITAIFSQDVAIESAMVSRIGDGGEKEYDIELRYLPDTGIASSYTFYLDQSLTNGKYLFTVSIQTRSGNENTYEEPFEIEVDETAISIIQPRLGVGSRLEFDLTLLTSRNGERVRSRCKYSTFAAAGFTSNGLLAFTRPADGTPSETHTITNFTGKFALYPNRDDANLFVYCMDDRDVPTNAVLHPKLDTIPPIITELSLDPGDWAEYPASGPFYTVATAGTSERAICKERIDLQSEFLPEPTYDGMTAFLTYDQLNASRYNTTNQMRIELRDMDQARYNISVQCEDMAGQRTAVRSALITVNLTRPLGILVTSPPPFTNNDDVTLNFTTSKASSCVYQDVDTPGLAEIEVTPPLNPAKAHLADYGRVADGRHRIRIACDSGAAGARQSEEKNHEFMVDTVPPTRPWINGTFVSCSETGFSKDMGIRFYANDTNSGIPEFGYYYRMRGLKENFTSSTNAFAGIAMNDSGPNINLTPKQAYTLEAFVQDRAGSNSTIAAQALLYDPGHWDCLEHDPPSLEIRKKDALGFADVIMECIDDSGCDNRSYRYGTGDKAANCTPSTPYAPAQSVHITRTSYACFFAKDMVGNNATLTQQVKVSQSNTCTDKIKDGDETDVDCGGGCGGTCDAGKACTIDDDCRTDYCNAQSVCAQPSCTDKVQNGQETDVDCGSGCPACKAGTKCKQDSDCATSFCNPASFLCQESTCTDSVKGPLEADADCGGVCQQKCADGKKCSLNTDCFSNYCSTFYNKCQAPGGGNFSQQPSGEGFFTSLWKNMGYIAGGLLIAGGGMYLAIKKSSPPVHPGPMLPSQQSPKIPLQQAQNPAQAQARLRQRKILQERMRQSLQKRNVKRQDVFKAFNISPADKADIQKKMVPLALPGAPRPTNTGRIPLPKKILDKIPQEEWVSLDILHQGKKQPSSAGSAAEAHIPAQRLEELKRGNDVFDKLDLLSKKGKK